MALMTAKSTRAFLNSAPAQAPDSAAQARQTAKLKQASRMFESYFLQQLMKEMRKTVGKGGLIGGGKGEEMFTDLMDQAQADRASAARSMGVADLIERQMTRDKVQRPGAERMKLPGDEAQQGQNLPNPGTLKTPSYFRSGYQRRFSASDASAVGDLIMPVSGEVTSTFGARVHPVSGELREHQGVDLAAPLGAPVRAARAGRVSFAGELGDYGNLVVVAHDDGSSAYYGHLDAMNVRQGQRVAQGQGLATVGQTGLTTGPHLHFEIRDGSGQAQDPLPQLVRGLNQSA
jgi:murein DD-endopeptidase MepM/ murein hydrolase activator NlpD